VATDGYVLITAARNEEAYIETTIRAVVEQDTRPKEWVIVSDGSTDGTDDIVRRYLPRHDFIRFVRRSAGEERSFASKVQAFRVGYQHLRETCYRYIGNLDGDVSFDRDYHDRILATFQADARLGIAGGFIYEEHGGRFVRRPSNSVGSVAGAVQLFRRECFEAIGGHVPLKYGGEDTWAEVMARMAGWRVRSVGDVKAYHHRRTASARGKVLVSRFVEGRADFALGNHPTFEAFKCIRRLTEQPYVVGTLCRLAGFVWGAIRPEERTVTPEFVRYLRKEQTERIRRLRRTE
jgi:biofilm PGA synthesis N-glycosyltransferase PgaC